MEGRKMQKRVIVVALLCVMGLATLAVGTASAAYGTFECVINKVTANYWGFYLVTLTEINNTFQNQQFLIVDDGSGMVKAQYASALTAFANSTNVVIGGDPVDGVIYELGAKK
jgi:hypothetical protein